MRRNQMKSVLALMAAGVLLLASSCKQGADCDEVWTSTVTDAQMESPTLVKDNFATRVNSDGSESVVVSWPVIHGAGGYEVKVAIVDDPANPEVVLEEIVDAPSFAFSKKEDTYYQVSVRTLGNVQANNKDAQTAFVIDYSTWLPAQVIPAGSDIVAFVKTNMVDTTDEQAFELEAGATYQLNDELDFGDKKVTFRSVKGNPATVVYGMNGVIRTSAGLKLKYINFDCEGQDWENDNITGAIEMSFNPPPTASAAARGITSGKGKKNEDCFVCVDPIIIQNCNFKDVKKCFFSVGNGSWGIADFRVVDCVIQMAFDGKKWSNGAFVCAYSKGFLAPSGGQFWYGGIKDMTFKNSTIYNTEENSKTRAFRFNNRDLDRVFPVPDGSATFENCTFYRLFDKKEWGNNTPNGKTYTMTFNGCIFKDVYRISKLCQDNNTKVANQATNTIWTDLANIESDRNESINKMTTRFALMTEENPNFAGPIDNSLDFSQPNFGVNFKASGAISSKYGDPRWH